MPSCVFCHEPLKRKMLLGFRFCPDCDVAVRDETDMPLTVPFQYDREWVRQQKSSRHHFLRARHAVKAVQTLADVTTILDVGCGTGILVDLLSRKGFQADGVDSSTEAIDYANEAKQGRFFLTPADHLHFEGGREYDLVIAAHLIEHLREPAAFFGELNGHLRPGGYIYLETPNISSYSARSLWRNKCGGMAGGFDHRILYSPRSLARLLRENGYEVIRVDTWSYPPAILRHFVSNVCRFLIGRLPGRKGSGTPGPKAIAAQAAAEKTGQNRSITRRIRRFVESLCTSWPMAALLFLPNRISELNERGIQVAIIAARTSAPDADRTAGISPTPPPTSDVPGSTTGTCPASEPAQHDRRVSP